MSSANEIMLAQEQSVVNKPTHLGILTEIEGTLILTNKRLIFACGSEKEEAVGAHFAKGEPVSEKIEDEEGNVALNVAGLGGIFTYSEVEDLNNIPQDPKNLFIPLSSITTVSGHKGLIGPPALSVKWRDKSGEKSTEFKETLFGGRRKNLNDWATVISRIKSGTQKIINLPPSPSKDSLEGKVLYILGDMQDKGLFEIGEETEEQFKLPLEPDDIEDACESFVSLGFVDRIGGPQEDKFYKKRSPLGDDDLSS